MTRTSSPPPRRSSPSARQSSEIGQASEYSESVGSVRRAIKEHLPRTSAQRFLNLPLQARLNNQAQLLNEAINNGSWRAHAALSNALDLESSRATKPDKEKIRSVRKALLPKFRKRSGNAIHPEGDVTEGAAVGDSTRSWSDKVYGAIRADDANKLTRLLNRKRGKLEELTQNGGCPLTVALGPPLRWKALIALVNEFPKLCHINEPYNTVQIPHRFLLHEAVSRRDKGAIETLFKKGALANVASELTGDTALHLAADLLSPSIVSLLLKYKANVDSRDRNGSTALLRAIQSKTEKIGKLKGTVEALLKATPSLLQADTPNITPIMALQNRLARLNTELNEAKTRDNAQKNASREFESESDCLEREKTLRHLSRKVYDFTQALKLLKRAVPPANSAARVQTFSRWFHHT